MKFRKILLTVLFAAALAVSAAAAPADAAADLHALGLLAGRSVAADGTVDFDLDGSLTRAEAYTQIVRFSGAENEVHAQVRETPFTDLASWAEPYIGYAYSTGLTKGRTATLFDPDTAVDEAGFLTILLRLLGYDDARGDFAWDDPFALAYAVGLTETPEPITPFSRGDAFVICRRALTAAQADGGALGAVLCEKGVITEERFIQVIGADAIRHTELHFIDTLNQSGTEGDHAADDILRASLETDFRAITELCGHARFTNCGYPRLKKLADDFYILFYQRGVHLYYTVSADCLTWSEPVVFRDAAKFPMAGGTGRYDAAGADAILLDDGSILVAYAVHPSVNYKTDTDASGLYVRRGLIVPNQKILWANEIKVYTGQMWEPSFLQLPDGTLQLYFTQIAPYISKYGFDEQIRSSGTAMLTSADGGCTWTPSIREGNTTYYRATTIFQQKIGEKAVTFAGKTITVPYFNGQMPQVIRLLDGRLLLAVEARQFNDTYTLSFATSRADGSWQALDFEEAGPDTTVADAFRGAAPYFAQFPSGEILLSYAKNSSRYGKLLSADATVFGIERPLVGENKGSFGSCTVIGSHAVVTVNPRLTETGDHTLLLYRAYLNHRINAKRQTVRVDGYTYDWANNTDALFVGSASQAQIAVQAAHDAENLYFLISRADFDLTAADTVSLSIAAGGNRYYKATVAMDGSVTVGLYVGAQPVEQYDGGEACVVLFGTMDDAADTDTGAVIELCLPKSLVGATDKTEFAVRPELYNRDASGSTSDTLTGTSASTTANWPILRLE